MGREVRGSCCGGQDGVYDPDVPGRMFAQVCKVDPLIVVQTGRGNKQTFSDIADAMTSQDAL